MTETNPMDMAHLECHAFNRLTLAHLSDRCGMWTLNVEWTG